MPRLTSTYLIVCGIAGILTQSDRDITSPLQAMLRALAHRGPDDQGLKEISVPTGQRLGLVHTRLAILDLTSAGHQPMHAPDSGSWIAYNGEVYNHLVLRRDLRDCQFQSTSDTETILKAWDRYGEATPARLRGMFAFALYDARRHQFWLVRDRLGVKPLYATRVDGRTWLFASELRALLASGLVQRHLHAGAVDAYLALGSMPAPWTLVDGIVSLLPGEAWRFDLTRSKGCEEPERIRYWRPPFVPSAGTVPDRYQAVEKIRPVLQDAVALRMLADVPVGVFLSGGIDSSAVVAALAHRGCPVRTFSVVFGEQDFDESQHSRRVASRFGTEHAELFLQPGKVLADIDDALGAYDQPSIDGVNTYFIARATRQAGVKVALSGLGGDELFAGYPYFRLLVRLDSRWFRSIAVLAYRIIRRLAPDAMRTVKLGALISSKSSPLGSYLVCRQVMPADRRARLQRNTSELMFRPPLPPEIVSDLESTVAGLDVVNAQSLLEISIYLANMLLRDTDQMSMAHALEVREPLLDHVLVETVARIPGSLKLAPGDGSRTKALLVDALPVSLPSAVVRRAKKGFVFPWERWLRRELKDRVTATLTNSAALTAAGLDPTAVSLLWGDYLAAKPGLRYTDILALLHLVDWVNRHRLILKPATPPAAVTAEQGSLA